jgi:quaternary ammonium compound-resistance protein SugE
MATSWIYLLAAGLLEIVWASCLKSTAGFTRLYPSLLTLAALIASFFLLGRAAQVLPMGTAYAVWTGIGAVGTALVGLSLAGEPATPLRLLCLFLIVAGTLGLKLTG